jgi:DNA-dependent protein kinase catalytic subunit
MIFLKETVLWIELAKLYRSMNDYDSIKGIFEKNTTLTTEFTQQGFEHESNNNYYRARDCYKCGLEHFLNEESPKKIPSIERDLWEQSLLRCCNELTDWKGMKNASMQNKTLSDLFKENTYTLENIFPYAFRSKVKLILQEQELNDQKEHEDLKIFLDNLNQDDKTYMESLFSQELALFNLHQKDFNASKYYANKAIQNYLDEWSTINKTIMQSRITKLQSLQTIVELNEFLNFIESNQAYTLGLNRKVENLISLWTNSMPNMLSDPPRTWDDVITNRCIYFEFIQDKYYSEKSDNEPSHNETTRMNLDGDDDEDEFENKIRENKKEIVGKIDKSKYFMKIKFAEAAQFQGNNNLALAKLMEIKKITKMQPSRRVKDLQIAYIHCYLKTHLSKANSSSLTSPKEKLDKFFKSQSLSELVKYDNCDEFYTHKELHQTHQLLHGQFCQFLVESFSSAFSESSEYFQEFKSDAKKTKQLNEYVNNSTSSDIYEAVEKIIAHGVKSLSGLNNDVKGSLELSIYCDHYLRQVENEEDDETLNNSKLKMNKIEMIKNDFPLIVVEQLLQAIRLNSYEARRRFPRLLQIVELYKDQTMSAFINSTDKCPSWMFIGWLSQMTALLDKPEAKAIYKIIENITNEYPQAIVYPFKMSLDSFEFDYKSQEQKAFVEKIRIKLNRIPLVNQFVAALEQLNTPDLLYKDYYQEIMSSNRENHLKIFPKMYYDLIDYSSQDDSNLDRVEWGNIRKNFSKELKKHFEQEFGKDAHLLRDLTEAGIKEKIRKIKAKTDLINSEEGNLGQFSPWLVAFKRNSAKDLEIPGILF